MSLVDFILNLAGLLLWFNWRAARYNPLAKPASITQAGPLKRKGTAPRPGWWAPLALLALVCGRAFFYSLLGPAVAWTGSLDLGPITIFFRTDQFWLTLLFSTLSFLRVLVLAHCWLLAVWVINRNNTTLNPITSLIRHQLGCVAGWPVYVQVVLPLAIIAAIWPGLHLLLTHAGITSPLPSSGRLLLQASLIALGTFLSLKYLIPALLLVDLLARYIFFGRSPIWEFLSLTAHNLLAPLQRLPLQAGRMDFTPLLGIALTLLLLHWLPRLAMQELSRRNLSFWPQ